MHFKKMCAGGKIIEVYEREEESGWQIYGHTTAVRETFFDRITE